MKSFVFHPAVGSRLLVNGIPFIVESSDGAAELVLKRSDTGQRVRYTVAELARMAMVGTCELADSAAKVKEFGIDLPCGASDGKFRRYTGDLSVSDKGEISVWEAV